MPQTPLLMLLVCTASVPHAVQTSSVSKGVWCTAGAKHQAAPEHAQKLRLCRKQQAQCQGTSISIIDTD